MRNKREDAERPDTSEDVDQLLLASRPHLARHPDQEDHGYHEDEQVHYATDVAHQRFGCEQQPVSEGLQSELERHCDHEHVFHYCSRIDWVD